MAAPINGFKQALLAGETVFGCWMSIGEAYTAEILSGAGFDWLLIDGEHAPNDLRSITAQLQVLVGRHSQPVVRLPIVVMGCLVLACLSCQAPPQPEVSRSAEPSDGEQHRR